MSTRRERAAMAAETEKIFTDERYRAPSGAEVDLNVAGAVAASRVVSPSEVAALAGRPGGGTVSPELHARTTLAAADAAAPGAKVGLLNFASARNPGGGWRSGALAQEETLGRASALVPTLEAHAETYYRANRFENSPLYTDHMIVSPGVPFFRGDDGALLETPYAATVITAPAPNAGRIKGDAAHLDALTPTFRRRMRAVLALAADDGVDRLVLGAWGCGVFRNDPALVARLWADILADAPANAFGAGVEMAIFDPARGGPVWRAFSAVFA